MLRNAVKRYGQASEEHYGDQPMKLPAMAQSIQNREEDDNIRNARISALGPMVRTPEAESGGDGGNGSEDVNYGKK